jgi:hypothetical protein
MNVSPFRTLFMAAVASFSISNSGLSQEAQPAATVAPASVKVNELDTSGPPYFAAHYRHMMRMPTAAKAFNQSGIPASIAQFVSDANGRSW